MEELVFNFGIWYIFYVIVLLKLFKNYLYSIFDPAVFIILMMASCLSLSMDSSFYWYCLFACSAFYLGVVTNGRIKRNTITPIEVNNFRLLELFTIGVFLLYFTANVILYKDASIPLFSDDATTNKIAIFGAGTGWIRRIFFFSNYLPIGLSLMCILTKSRIKRSIYLILMILFMIISILLGSKSGFLGIFYIIWFFYTQTNLWRGHNIDFKVFIEGKIKYVLIGSILIFVFIVYGENVENPNFFWISLGFRLMEFGDVMLYYKLQIIRDSFSQYNLIDFLKSEFNGILGLLRIVDYQQPLGFLMSKVYNGDSGNDVITGPNTVFLVRGHLFFGYVGGILYSYYAGWSFSIIRLKILNYKVKNIFVYSILIFILFNLDGFLREFSQSFSVFFDFIIFTFPIFIVSLLYEKKLNIQNKI